MKKTLLVLLFTLTSCSLFKGKEYVDYSHLGELSNKDFIDHLSSKAADYLGSEDVKEIKLKQDSRAYLDNLYDRLILNNEILLTKEHRPAFHFVVNKTPFIFSLPKAQFFISTGLIEKYLKSEELFVAALSSEILKSDRNIYEKKQIIPLGFISTEKMISITRLKLETKYQINEWSYYILLRSGFDASAFLNWIQVQNRNTLDFSLFLGDAIGISREEHFFKNFMTKQGIAGAEKYTSESNSSKLFYKLVSNVVSNK